MSVIIATPPHCVLASPPHCVRWQGLIEVIYTEYKEVDIPESIKVLKKRLEFLESAKTLQEIRDRLVFTLEERNYLNSPPLDELYKTIFSGSPMKKAVSFACSFAYNFYLERGCSPIKLSRKFIENEIRKDNIACIKFIDEKALVKVREENSVIILSVIRYEAEKIFKYLIEKKYIAQNSKYRQGALETFNARFLNCAIGYFELTQEHKDLALFRVVQYFSPIEIMKILVENGAKVNSGYTLLSCAIFNQKIPIIKFLLENKVTITQNDLFACCQFGTAEILRMLHEYDATHFGYISRLEFFRTAAQHGNLDIVKYLVEFGGVGADAIALSRAQTHGREEVVQYLLSLTV